jgi:ribosomal protein S27E
MELVAGTRLRCETCGSEGIVVKAAAADLTCCGAPLVPTFVPGGKPPGGAAPSAG